MSEIPNHSRLPQPQPLPAGEAHLWYAWPERIVDPELVRGYESLLSAAELARCRRFMFEEDQHLYLVAHALVRTTLSRYADVDPRHWEFSEGLHGKPDIAGPIATSLKFNLSHADGCAACLVANEIEIGVDVENVSRQVDVLGLSRRFFSEAEADELASLPAAEQQGRFIDYWTLKEAYVKAQGQGLAIPLEAFTFHLSNSGPVRITFAESLPDDPADWQFQQWVLETGHKLGAALHRRRHPDLTIVARNIVPPASPLRG